MRSTLSVWVQYLLPQRVLAALVYRVARCTWPFVKNPLIRWFANRYRVDLDEVEQPDLSAYPTFNDFFTRRLQRDARPVAGDDHTIVSPADGYLTDHGIEPANNALIAAEQSRNPAHGRAIDAESSPGHITGALQRAR